MESEYIKKKKISIFDNSNESDIDGVSGRTKTVYNIIIFNTIFNKAIFEFLM